MEEVIPHRSLVNARELYNKIMVAVNVTSILSSEDLLHEISDKLNADKRILKEHRTVNFWLQYIKKVDILHMLIKAEKIGDWNLHLQAVQEVVPYFAKLVTICIQVCLYLFTEDATTARISS